MRLGEMLLKAAVVTEAQLQAGIAEQQRSGGKLGEILVRTGVLTEELLVMALSTQLQIPRVDLGVIGGIPPALRDRFPRELCEKHRVLPLAWVPERQALQLAMSDPFDMLALDEITELLQTRIEPFIVGDQALAAAIARLFATGGPMHLAPPNTSPSGFPAPGAHTPAHPGVDPHAAPFPVRVGEHTRALRAVADLLIARGVIRPDELKR